MNTKLLGIVMAGCAGCAASGDGGGQTGTGDLVDDLEDGDDLIEQVDGRLGGWYTFHDDTAAGVQTPGDESFTPDAGGAGDSAYAARTTGSGFTDWGAGMGFDLNNPEAIGETGARGTYDATGYSSISFRAKGNVPVRFALETAGVTPTDRGGTCTPSTTEGKECDDLHGQPLALTSDWKEFDIEFDKLRQEGWGLPVDFDASTSMAVLFTADQGLEFDFAVDDVELHE